MLQLWWIIGAGYTGSRLADRLAAQGHAVLATRRTAVNHEAEGEARIRWRALDLDDPDLVLEAPAQWRDRVTYVVCCAPPGERAGEREHRLAQASRGAARLIYISSTGVYAPGGGQWVDEQWPIAPEGALGKARALAEARLIAAADAGGLPWTILRAAGIYGPGRGLVARVRDGQARVIGDGASHVSRIHVEDLVSAVLAAADRGVGGAINCADDDPAPHGTVWDGVAAALGMPQPPRIAPEGLSDAARAMLLADRKVANRRMREELGVELRYPSWRDAVRAELSSGRLRGEPRDRTARARE
jgi:nucleoside-diphosphate-sugar epimerase